jgi:hypothetical protein
MPTFCLLATAFPKKKCFYSLRSLSDQILNKQQPTKIIHVVTDNKDHSPSNPNNTNIIAQMVLYIISLDHKQSFLSDYQNGGHPPKRTFLINC